MDMLVNIARWLFQVHFDWSCVILGAIFGALLDRVVQRKRAERYDGWWFVNLNPSDSAGRANRGE